MTTIDSITGEPIPVYLRYWRYHARAEEEYNDILDACRVAIYLEDNGEASIEEIEADGMVLSGIEEIEAYYERSQTVDSPVVVAVDLKALPAPEN